MPKLSGTGVRTPRVRLPKVESASSLFDRLVPVLLVATIVLSFVVGVLWERVNRLEKGGSVSNTTTGNTTTTQQAAQQEPNVTDAQIKDLFKKDVIKFGDANKKLTFVEVSDTSCPYCHIAGGLNPDLNNQSPQFKLAKDGGTYIPPVIEIKKLVDAGKASFVYIYFPGHGNGEMGAKALYCANEKGKFWQAHDLIMNSKGYDLLNNSVKNDKGKSQELANFLASAVNVNDMKTCLESGKYDSRIQADMALAQSLGVQGTPGFFVNTTPFTGAYSFKDMQSAVDAALK